MSKSCACVSYFICYNNIRSRKEDVKKFSNWEKQEIILYKFMEVDKDNTFLSQDLFLELMVIIIINIDNNCDTTKIGNRLELSFNN